MKKYKNDNELLEAVIYLLMAFSVAIALMLLCTSCSQPAEPQTPTQREIRDSVKMEIAEKKLNYILQTVKEK
jgi:hypothetical protein